MRRACDMRKTWFVCTAIILMVFLVVSAGAIAAKKIEATQKNAVTIKNDTTTAQDETEREITTTGSGSIVPAMVDGDRDSAKFNEYRDQTDGASIDFDLLHRKQGKYFLWLKANNLTKNDWKLDFSTGAYGKYKVEFNYDQIPHRFAFDARTLYSGVGSGTLTIPDSTQSYLQATPGAGNTQQINLANRLTNTIFPGASFVDLELMRHRSGVNFEVNALSPVNFRTELSWERRTGTRPFGTSFGFGAAIESPEPIDYETFNRRFMAEYAKDNLFANVTYNYSTFHNNIGTVTFDNPFRATDSTNASAYSQNVQNGASKGLIDLYPDNKAENLSISGTVSKLPGNSRFSANASWGQMRQNDPLVAYTTNTAIIPGAAVQGGVGAVPFNASNRANLPVNSIDAKVNTSLYNFLFTSNPAKALHLKAKYRNYEYNNKTAPINFPGGVTFDQVWNPTPEENIPLSYRKSTASIEGGYDLFKGTRLTMTYTNDNMRRKHREVANSTENSYKVAVDSKPVKWLDLRTWYEWTSRRGAYDYTVPFEGETVTPQLPFLRKFDEANRDSNRAQFLATVYPTDSISLTGSLTSSKDNYKDSLFGLLNSEQQTYALDVDYSVTDRLDLYSFFGHERYKRHQRARQWTPASFNDPYTTATGFASNSNWDAVGTDVTKSFGGGLKYEIIPEKMAFDAQYSYSKTNGVMSFMSPLGSSSNDANAFSPIDFPNIDTTTIQTIHTKLNYELKKNLFMTLGWISERYNNKDITNIGFAYIPTTVTGAFNSAVLMGALPKNYNVNTIYSKFTIKF